MLDCIDRRLEEWALSTVSDVDVRFSMPLVKVETPTVVMVLLQMTNVEPSRGWVPRAEQFVLHYLVTVCAQAIDRALPMLDQLFIAALEDEDLSIDQRPILADVWETIGVRPQPSFRLVVPLQAQDIERSRRFARDEVEPALTTFDGVVLGPDDEPIPRARIEVSDTEDVVYSDRFGRFRFPTDITPSTESKLQVSASGLEESVVERPSGKPIVIRVQPHA